MPSPGKDTEINNLHAHRAAREAITGAMIGGAKWGLVSLLGSFGAFYLSPLYRGLTIQFRLYLWMIPTAFGSMVEADDRLRNYEKMVRLYKRAQLEEAREAAMVEELAAAHREEQLRMSREAGKS